MKNIVHVALAALLVFCAVIPGKAEKCHFDDKGKGQRAQTAAGCTPSSSFEWLDINNVKTRINAGGDMWWDLPGGVGSKYFIPANGAATSLYAGSLWIAGVDVNQQLKCAALRFRQVGNDYYTGPLTIDGKASVTPETCAKWDKIFKITRAEVDQFLAAFDETTGKLADDYKMPSIIEKWPAHPSDEDAEGISKYLAPFYDKDGDGLYNPYNGDYPYYDIDNELCHTKIPTMDEEIEGSIHGSLLADQVLKGDQTLWWIFNDKGASHTESQGQAIGMEIRAQAFAFATNDEINNMTFYSYEIINRSTYTLTGTYFSPWTDVDLGYAKDDYVGCDVERGLGYGYNGSATDGSGQPEAYGAQPPAVGIDFFQGPYMDPDGIDNPKYTFLQVFDHVDPISGDSIFVNDSSTAVQVVDESINGVNFGNGIVDDERFGMRRFVYHNNSSADNGDPNTAPQYYNYLRGIWKNGAKMQYGGNAFSGSDVVGPECDFMFPGDSDPWNWGTGGALPNGGFNQNNLYWTEAQCQNAPDDRRFMQSAGPFTLEPGAVNYITFGVPWARASSGGAWASVELLRVVDDKCQALFDNCFKVIDGPNAPDLTIRELDQELIIYLSNTALSNNYKEGYIELDPEIPTSRIETTTYHETVYAYVGCHDTTVYIPREFDPSMVTYDTVECVIAGVDTTLLVPQGYYPGAGVLFDTINCQVGCVLDTLMDPIEHENTEEIFYDRYYRFEGYKVYQLVNNEVGADELNNTDKARLVFQCDIRNNVTRLINYNYDESIQARVPELKVEGSDAGITHSFVVTEDKFSTGDNPNLVNHKTYYYMAVSYAYNNYLQYSQDDALGLQGQQKPYLEGRKNIKCYAAVPHKTVNGTVLNSVYGDKPAIQRIVGMGNGNNDLELTDETVAEILSKQPASAENVFGGPDYPVSYHPKYKAGYGPIDVKIVDPLNVVATTYNLWFTDFEPSYTYNITGNQEVQGDSAARMASHWFLKDMNPAPENPNDTVPIPSDTTTVYGDEQMFIDRGISITIKQPYDFGCLTVGQIYYDNDWHPYLTVVAENNGVITSSIEFTDPEHPWLDGIRDTDNLGAASELNWIRSGTYSDINNGSLNDYSMSSGAYTAGASHPWDPNENFENIAGGSWAPVLLTTYSGQVNDLNPGPVYSGNCRVGSYFHKTNSLDIVLTSDTNLWTRCPVIEMCMDNNLSEGGAKRFNLRKHASVDKQGRPTTVDWQNHPDSCSLDPSDANYIGAQGMGWFPGYVIDVESGMRLNLAFGEDSYYADSVIKGRDMIFNPAKLQKTTLTDPTYQMVDPAIYRGADYVPVFGGKHFVYIFRDDSIAVASSSPWKEFVSPAYDGGARVFKTLNHIQHQNDQLQKLYNTEFWKLVQWVGMPMGVQGEEWLPEGNDCRIRIRLAKPYDYGYGPNPLKVTPDELMINDLRPMYSFSIEGLNPTLNDPEKTEEDLNLITVTPNPYYAYSDYEPNALTNRVKIANLPEKCVVTIYTLSGTKVRQFTKDNDEPSIEWDLTNFANTPVSSGFYLIHIKDFTSGSERVIKFYGAMRKVDLNTF